MDLQCSPNSSMACTTSGRARPKHHRPASLAAFFQCTHITPLRLWWSLNANLWWSHCLPVCSHHFRPWNNGQGAACWKQTTLQMCTTMSIGRQVNKQSTCCRLSTDSRTCMKPLSNPLMLHCVVPRALTAATIYTTSVAGYLA